MKMCYSSNEYRNFKDGITNNDLLNISDKTNTMATWYFYGLVRVIQKYANEVWQDVVGENVNFKLSVANWADLNEKDKKDYKELEANILSQVGPAFKVLESQIKGTADKEKFTHSLRHVLDAYVYIQ